MNKGKFLWILPYYPYPPVTGGNVRIYNLIRNLSDYYSIHLLAYYDAEPEELHVKALEEFCDNVTLVKREEKEGKLPLIFQYYTTDAMTECIKECLKERYDFVQIDFLTMAYYVSMIKEMSSVPVFFTEHDVSSFYFDKCFHNRHLGEKERYVEWVKMRDVMDRIYGMFDTIFTVSHNDAAILREKLKRDDIYAAPTGTDCAYYAYRPGHDANDLVFVGHFLHYPNVDSVRYLVDDVMPLLEKEFPDICLNVVGSGGRKVLEEMEKYRVRVTGTVPDIRPYLYSSIVFAAPIRMGIGIRGKILEAMACGLPVVTTPLGAEGIGAAADENILIAEDASEFSSHVARIIRDETLRKSLAENARRFVEDNYDWSVITEDIVSLYAEVLKR